MTCRRPAHSSRAGPVRTAGRSSIRSRQRIDEAVAYRFSLGHCGLLSPVDVDGSFWDPIDGTDPAGAELDLETNGEMINATAGRHRRHR